MSSDEETVMAVYDEWEAANEKVAALSLDALTHTELLELQHRREVVARSLPATDHQIINRLVAEADQKALGGTSWADVLATRWPTHLVQSAEPITLAAHRLMKGGNMRYLQYVRMLRQRTDSQGRDVDGHARQPVTQRRSGHVSAVSVAGCFGKVAGSWLGWPSCGGLSAP